MKITKPDGTEQLFLDMNILSKSISIDAYALAMHFVLPQKFPERASDETTIRMLSINPQVLYV